MTIDWVAEARRVTRGRRFDAAGSPSAAQDRSPDPPLSEAEIREAEAELGIPFPGEYREWLLRHDVDSRVNRLRRAAEGWGWQGDSSTNYGLLTAAFPHPDSYRGYQDELDAREPLRENHARDDAYRAAWAQWDAEYEVFQERRTSGAVFIQENGCGFSTLLVVTGPHRGTMWFDARATCDRILPMKRNGQPVSFGSWLGRNSMDLVGW
ncbi:SMI1/KNR4 family protein [Streptomyces sp. NBC_00414]|uniref:SMI1/KNR4 family protein n=1 Tax=Streptomyces sp. NBC_00414 TaxID=2975739 RepID=UPI002E1F8357